MKKLKRKVQIMYTLNVMPDEFDADMENLVFEESLEPCPLKRQAEAQIQELKQSLNEVQTKLENEAEDKQMMTMRINQARCYCPRRAGLFIPLFHMISFFALWMFEIHCTCPVA